VSSAAGNAKRWGHDADIDGIDADLSKATRLLSAISPRSRALAKLARRQSRTIVAGTPVGNPTGTPEAIPTQSQETGKRKGQRQGQGSSKNDCLIGARERADDQLKIEGTEDQALFDVVAATGFILTDDNREGAASIVRGWLDNGLDLNTAILPAIRAAMPKLKGPTSSLTRFSKIVQHAHAQAKAKAPAPATSGAAVKFEFEDEPCAMADIRRDIAAGLGENRYVLFQDSFRLEPVPERAALQITKTGAVQVFDDNRVGPIRKAAAKHGFSDVWAN